MVDVFGPDQQLTFLRLLYTKVSLQDILVHLAQMVEARVPGTACELRLGEAVVPHACLHGGEHTWHLAIHSDMGHPIGHARLCRHEGAHTKEPRSLLETVARLAALAYDRQRLPAEVIERSRLAALAVRISEIQSRTLPLHAMLQQCTDALVHDLKMAFARIWLFNESEQMLILAASAGLSTNLHGAYSRVPVATSLKIGRMVQDRQPRLTNTIQQETWIKEPEWAKREGLIAYAGYPLIAEDRVVGVIAMFAKHPLPDHTLQALAVMAGGFAQAIIKSEADHRRQEMVKELQALHGTASLLQLNEAGPQLLQAVVALLPAAWRYPDIAAARIVFADQEYCTGNFHPTPWRQTADFRLSDGRTGCLEVVYLEERPPEAEGPFLLEERRLIDSLAEMLRNYLERKHSEEALRESRDLLRQLNATLEEQVKARTGQLVAKQDQLRSLAVELSRAEERARRQLATDLHDHLAQLLVLAKIKLQGEHASQGKLRSYDEAKGLLDEALTYTRSVMADLRPPLLSDAQDLHRAIVWVVDRVTCRGLQVMVHDDGQPIDLDEEVLTVTYQAIHELLFNVLKHAGTRQATLTLQCGTSHLEVVVQDQGAGFDVHRRAAASKDGGFGLLNIRERVELLGGRLEIASRIGEGTCSRLIMPLKTDSPSPHALAKYEGQAAWETADSLPPPAEPAEVLIRIVLVDDHRMVREGLRSLLEEHTALRIVAEASDGQMAIQVARQLRPDIILMDVNMPKMNGLEATRHITQEFPGITVIGLSMHDDEKMALAMRQAGAVGYVSKGEAAEKLVGIIGEARNGRHAEPAASL